MKNIKQIIITVFALIVFVTVCGCKKLIEVEPPINEIVGSEAYKNNATANGVVVGIYSELASGSLFAGAESVDILMSLSADELASVANNESSYSSYYSNALNSKDRISLFWNQGYSLIFRINSAIEGCSNSKGITADLKKQLLAELKFLRAYTYFYLVSLYGDVPLITSTDVKTNSVAPRANSLEVWKQIELDLSEAKNELNSKYVGANGLIASGERVRPNAYAASALLARVYLHEKKWDLAEVEATNVINQHSNYQLESLERVFLSDSKEAIWQLQPTYPGFNTLTAPLLVLKALDFSPSGPSADSRPLYLSDQLYQKFDDADLRKLNWTDTSMVVEPNSGNLLGVYPYANKYKIAQRGLERTEYYMMIRLAELFLIRAESRVMLGKFSGNNSAESDVNVLHNRAGLQDITITSQSTGIDKILNERNLELFTEGGHRWLDLKRTERLNALMTTVAPMKGSAVVWSPYKSLLPIPSFEFVRNPSLRGHQNPGYTEN